MGVILKCRIFAHHFINEESLAIAILSHSYNGAVLLSYFVVDFLVLLFHISYFYTASILVFGVNCSSLICVQYIL